MHISNTLSLDAFLQCLQEPALLLNTAGIIQQINPALEQLLGYTSQQLLGQALSILCKHQDFPTRVPLDWTTKQAQEWLFYQQDGTALSLHCRCQALGQTKDALFLVLLLPHQEQPVLNDYLAQAEAQLDQTLHHKEQSLQEAMKRLQQHQEELEQEILERQAMEKQLLAAQAKIQSALDRSRELSDLKTRFIATASHEFRTPLSSILSSAALIERYPTTAQQDKRLKHVNRIKSSVQNLTHILEDFLSLSFLEEGKVQQQHQSFALDALLQSVLEEVKVMAKAKQQFVLQQQFKDLVLDTNLQALKNILLNLLSNAIKYSPDEALIQIRAHTEGEQVIIGVQDHGMGIPKEQQKHLFTRFFRADNATAIQGTGLGLYIVQKYLEQLHGSIRFESVENQGTTFTIQFPKIASSSNL